MIKKLLFISSFIVCTTASKAQWGAVLLADSTNFETNPSLAVIDTSAGNIWQIGLPAKTFFGIPYSAPFAIMTDSVNSYPSGNLSSFTVTLDSGFLSDAYIGFWHKYETDAGKDGGYVEFSADSGATWANVITAYTVGVPYIYPTNFYAETDTISGGIPAFSGVESGWKYSEIYLQWMFALIHPHDPAPRDLYFTQRAMFRFSFKSDAINTLKAGWIIDNVVIGTRDIGGGITTLSKNDLNVHVFPNPAEGETQIQVTSNGHERMNLKIFSILGYTVFGRALDENGSCKLESGTLLPGIYLYEVTGESGTLKTGKLIIK